MHLMYVAMGGEVEEGAWASTMIYCSVWIDTISPVMTRSEERLSPAKAAVGGRGGSCCRGYACPLEDMYCWSIQHVYRLSSTTHVTD